MTYLVLVYTDKEVQLLIVSCSLGSLTPMECGKIVAVAAVEIRWEITCRASRPAAQLMDSLEAEVPSFPS